MDKDYKGQEVMVNPYVAQADRFASSLRHLADTFLKMEGPRETFTREETRDMFDEVTGKVCALCKNKESCLKKDREQVYELMYEILCTVEEYGSGLNVEMKRKLQKRCILAPRFLRETLGVFGEAKKMLAWNNKMVQSREGCAVQLNAFAQMIRHATRELDASIFTDTPMEKRIRAQMKKEGVRLLSSVFFVNARGRYEIHLTVRPEKGICMTTRALARALSACVKRRMVPAKEERPVLAQEYCTVVFVEGPGFYTLQGVARIGKGCEKISGDSFLMTELPGGQEAAILSDGMGAGEEAGRESAMVVEMLEELLMAGFPRQTALQMLNTALVMGREEVCFSTLDMCVFDLYSGVCEFVKAGAATTFVRHGDKIEHIYSESLPLGVVQKQKIEEASIKLKSGDLVVMVTDGVLDALPAGEQEYLLDLMLRSSEQENPKELAHEILEKVLELGQEEPLDDMTVLVAGIWDLC
ncbi:SpoIIE family protein phosphatase [Roseburia hominis]